MNCTIEITDFEGPLDLLLHLIKKSEMDIFDISIEDITKQYLDYIMIMEELNLSIASEYLVMAAELVEIKSSILLPKREIEKEDDYEEDPRNNLINRLVEYEKYKEISEILKTYEKERKDLYTKTPSELEEYVKTSNEVKENFQLTDLMSALNKMLERKTLDKPLNTKITNKEYSINERSTEIRKIINNKKKVEFTELFNTFSKDYIVVTFLSVLTMARNNEIRIIQESNFDNIMIEKVGG